ncbi:MAG TPA: SDR family oxidoreductase [bacterium]|nr:SDR family oxidoreductase [bacterium]HPP08875.1 SDR family oxidoreductase [bacterium]
MLRKLNTFPGWVPLLEDHSCILVVGASGGIGKSLVKMMLKSNVNIGCHFATNRESLREFEHYENVKFFPKVFSNGSDCKSLVEEFYAWKKKIDALVVLSGGIKNPVHWEQMNDTDWEADIFLNLSVPFYLAQTAIQKMKESKNTGKIILTGTESALHGGGSFSLAYGVAKMGIECLVKGLARDVAKYGILVNGIRPGFILSGFHERWQKKKDSDLEKRVELIPLKRPGYPEEVSALILYLLSGWANFITGQMFPITGGDWL